MSKLLVALHNYTDTHIWLYRKASGRADIGLPHYLGKGKHAVNWEIPDNSDSSKYFKTNNMTVVIDDPATKETTEFRLWDDDSRNFDISYCEGHDWMHTTRPMRGGNRGANYTKVKLHVVEHPPQSKHYELTAIVVTDDDLTKAAVQAFQGFRNHPDVQLTPSKAYTLDEMKAMMFHPAFQPVRVAAATAGFNSLAVIRGGGGSYIIGGELQFGALERMGGGESSRMATAVVSLGFSKGGDAFVGVYMSSALPSEVAGFEFFGEVAFAYYAGTGVQASVSLTGNHGLSILLTTGMEIDISVGVGYTIVTKFGPQ